MSAAAPSRWIYALLSLAIAIATGLLLYWFECRISG